MSQAQCTARNAGRLGSSSPGRDDASRFGKAQNEGASSAKGDVNGNQTGARKSAARERRAGLSATRAADASRRRLPFPRIFSRSRLPFPRIFSVLHFRAPGYFRAVHFRAPGHVSAVHFRDAGHVSAVHFRPPVYPRAVLRLVYFRDPEFSRAREREEEKCS